MWSHMYLFAIYPSISAISHPDFYNKMKIYCTTQILTEGSTFKLQPVPNLEKVAYRLFLEKLDKRKSLGHGQHWLFEMVISTYPWAGNLHKSVYTLKNLDTFLGYLR